MKENSTDVAIVLGFPAHNNGQPTGEMLRRVNRAVELYLNGHVRFLLMSGGAVYSKWVEADVMTNWAISKGVPAENIVREQCSKNTQQNAFLSSELMRTMGWRTAVVVTAPAHCRRAYLAFQFYEEDPFNLFFQFVPSRLGPFWWVVGQYLWELLLLSWLHLVSFVSGGRDILRVYGLSREQQRRAKLPIKREKATNAKP